MNDEAEKAAYVARLQCGCCMGICKDAPEDSGDVLREKADFLRYAVLSGAYIERVTGDAVTAVVQEETFLACPHRPAYVGIGSRFYHVRAELRQISDACWEVELDAIGAGDTPGEAVMAVVKAYSGIDNPVYSPSIRHKQSALIVDGEGEEWEFVGIERIEDAAALVPESRQMELRGEKPLFDLEALK